MASFVPPDPLDPKKFRPNDETFPDQWDAWANGDTSSRPLSGEVEFVGRPDPPMTSSQKWMVTSIIMGGVMIILVLVFVINFAIDRSEHSDKTVSQNEVRKQSVQKAASSNHDLPVIEEDEKDSEVDSVAATIRVVGLKQRLRGFDPEMERIAATIKIVPLGVSAAVPLPAAATQ